jgi:hypothetical protein
MSDVAESAAPAGMKRNSVGGWTPISIIKPQVSMEDDLVVALVARARALARQLATFREDAFGDADAFLELLAEKYGAPRGGTRGNVTFESFDGLSKMQIATGDFITFGPELQVAKSLIDDCLTRWADGAGAELKTIVNDAFDVGKEGKIQVDRVLKLRRLQIEDETWCRAMGAIGDAVKVTHSKRYVRFYTRANWQAPWSQISLDLSRAEL